MRAWAVDVRWSIQRVEYPVRTNQIPRQIPTQVFYLRPLPSILLGGILPFGAIFIELYFILNSIWFNRSVFLSARAIWHTTQERLTSGRAVRAATLVGLRIYYVFGFLFLVFSILCLTCAEVTILLCYFHLCAEVRRDAGRVCQGRGPACVCVCVRARSPWSCAARSGPSALAGLPLVVASVPDLGLFCLLHARVRHHLLLHAVGLCRHGVDRPLFWLDGRDGPAHVCRHR